MDRRHPCCLAAICLLATLPVRAGSDITALQHPAGLIAFRFQDHPFEETFRSRILIDFDGPATGEPNSGADWMIEQGGLFAFAGTDTAWNWNRIDDAAVSPCGSAVLVVPLTPPPRQTGSFMVDINPAGLVDADGLHLIPRRPFAYATLPHWPPECDPRPYDLGHWQTNRADTLSVGLARALTNRVWPVSGTGPAPSWVPPGTPEPITLRIVLHDPMSGQSTPLDNGVLTTEEGTIRWSGESEAAAWSFLFEGMTSRVLTVTGHVTGNDERSLEIRMGLKSALDDWSWHDIPGSSRPMYPSDIPLRLSAGMPAPDTDRLPFGVISSPDRLRIILNDPSEPRAVHIEADPANEVFGLVYNLAVTPKTRKFPGQTSFRCSFIDTARNREHDPLLAAAAIVYDLYPALYAARPALSGSWRPFPPVDDPAPGLSEPVILAPGTDPAPYRSGALLHTEPWYHWLPLPPSTPRTGRAILDRLDRVAQSGNHHAAEWAAASQSSAIRRDDNQPVMDILQVPWNDGARIAVSADPDLISPANGMVSRAMTEARMLDTLLPRKGWIGVYVDSLGELDHPNHYPPALAAADFPVMIDDATMTPVVHPKVGALEWLTTLRAVLTGQGRYLVGNGALESGNWFNGVMDAFAETAFLGTDELAEMLVGEEAELMRLQAGKRPVIIQVMADFDTMHPAQLELLYQHGLRFGFIPVLHSKDGFNGLYEHQPAWIRRDQAVHAAYLPLLQRMAAAGWNPTGAVRVVGRGVQAASFDEADGASFLSLYNPAPLPAIVLLEWPVPEEDGLLLFPLTGETSVHRAGHPRSHTVRLEPGDTAVAMTVPLRHADREAAWLEQQTSPASRAAAANLASLLKEHGTGVSTGIEFPSRLIRGEGLEGSLVFHHAGPDPITVSRINLHAGGRKRYAVDRDITLAPGERRTVFVNLRARDVKDDAPIELEWHIGSGDQSVTAMRRWLPPRSEATEVLLDTGPHVSFDPVAAVNLTIINNRSETRTFEITATGDAVGGSTTRTITLEPETGRIIPIHVPSMDHYLQDVSVSVAEEGRGIFREDISISYLPPDASMLRDSRVDIIAGPSADGYRIDVLRDGITDTRGRTWTEGAWLSAEHTGRHVLAFRFPQPLPAGTLTLYWPRDAAQSHPPRTLSVLGRMEDGRLVNLGTLHPEADEAASTVDTANLPLREIILVQPPAGGSRLHPLALWIAEVELR